MTFVDGFANIFLVTPGWR